MSREKGCPKKLSSGMGCEGVSSMKRQTRPRRLADKGRRQQRSTSHPYTTQSQRHPRHLLPFSLLTATHWVRSVERDWTQQEEREVSVWSKSASVQTARNRKQSQRKKVNPRAVALERPNLFPPYLSRHNHPNTHSHLLGSLREPTGYQLFLS